MSNESAKAEVDSAFHHFAWAKVIVLGVNTLVVAYLFFHLVNKRRRACTRWEAQAAALSRHHAVIRLSAFLLLCIGVQIVWNGADALLGSVRLQVK